jgi:hypothetical protein
MFVCTRYNRRLIVVSLFFWSTIPFFYIVLKPDGLNTVSNPPSFASQPVPIERTVEEPVCKMPSINPFDPAFMKYFNKTYSGI